MLRLPLDPVHIPWACSEERQSWALLLSIAIFADLHTYIMDSASWWWLDRIGCPCCTVHWEIPSQTGRKTRIRTRLQMHARLGMQIFGIEIYIFDP